MNLKKQELRYLSIGFFISAIILNGYQLMGFSNNNAPIATPPQEEVAMDTAVSSEEIGETDSTVPAETEETEDTSNEDSTEESATEEEALEPTTLTIVVNEGDPSSVVADQLAAEGFIDNALEFDTYLENQDVATKIRPGSYDVTSDMDFDQMIAVLVPR